MVRYPKSTALQRKAKSNSLQNTGRKVKCITLLISCLLAIEQSVYVKSLKMKSICKYQFYFSYISNCYNLPFSFHKLSAEVSSVGTTGEQLLDNSRFRVFFRQVDMSFEKKKNKQPKTHLILER